LNKQAYIASLRNYTPGIPDDPRIFLGTQRAAASNTTQPDMTVPLFQQQQKLQQQRINNSSVEYFVTGSFFLLGAAFFVIRRALPRFLTKKAEKAVVAEEAAEEVAEEKAAVVAEEAAGVVAEEKAEKGNPLIGKLPTMHSLLDRSTAAAEASSKALSKAEKEDKPKSIGQVFGTLGGYKPYTRYPKRSSKNKRKKRRSNTRRKR
jgi:hypothetical protein